MVIDGKGTSNEILNWIPSYEIYVTDYKFLSFAKKTGKHLSSKYDQKLFGTRKKLTTAKKKLLKALKNASKGAIQNTAEATGDLVAK